MARRFDRLTLMETFVRIAERRSLSAAARDLGVSQPSVSRQIAALEDGLGAILLRRTTHDVSLTEDGRTLLVDARRMLAEWDAVAERHAAGAPLTGMIRVVAPVALGQGMLIAALAPFLAEHPDVSIDWRLRDDPIRFAELGCDAWIRVGDVPDDTLIVRPLGAVERMVVAVPPLAGGPLEAAPWVTLGPYEGSRIMLFGQDGPRQFTVTPRLASDNIFAVREAVRAGVGAAILPRWFVADDLDAGRLVDLAPDLRAARLLVNLALAAGTRRPARLHAFCEALTRYCALALRTP